LFDILFDIDHPLFVRLHELADQRRNLIGFGVQREVPGIE
jgi:hypothetical protein